jgi:hypothetical protein
MSEQLVSESSSFQAILGTTCLMEPLLAVLAVCQQTEIKETKIWPQTDGFFAAPDGSMLLMRIGTVMATLTR